MCNILLDLDCAGIGFGLFKLMKNKTNWKCRKCINDNVEYQKQRRNLPMPSHSSTPGAQANQSKNNIKRGKEMTNATNTVMQPNYENITKRKKKVFNKSITPDNDDKSTTIIDSEIIDVINGNKLQNH